MRLDRLTSKFQHALSEAQSLALGRDHAYIEPAHVLLAMLNQEQSSIQHLLQQIGANPSDVRTKVAQVVDKLPKVTGSEVDLHLSQGLTRVLNQCDKLAQKRQDQFIASELFYLPRSKIQAR